MTSKQERGEITATSSLPTVGAGIRRRRIRPRA